MASSRSSIDSPPITSRIETRRSSQPNISETEPHLSMENLMNFPDTFPEITSLSSIPGGDLDLLSLSVSVPNLTESILDPKVSTIAPVPLEIPTEYISGSEESRGDLVVSGDTIQHFGLQFSSPQMNAIRKRTSERIVDFVDEQLDELQETHKAQISELVGEQCEILRQVKKQNREIKKMNERNELLRQQLVSLHSDNSSLRDTIIQLEGTISSRPENTDVTTILQDIKAKLWGDSINITPEKKKRIGLLKRLSQTGFKDTNEKHCALLNRLWQLHSPNNTEKDWTLIGFKTNNPGKELESTGILGLQNLVYFSERYNALAKARSGTDQYKWALAGISITALLTSLLHLHGDKGFFSDFAPKGIFKTFITLMNHPKAFEELYCVCFMIFDNLATVNAEDALENTKLKLKELLLANPKDLQELIQVAKCV